MHVLMHPDRKGIRPGVAHHNVIALRRLMVIRDGNLVEAVGFVFLHGAERHQTYRRRFGGREWEHLHEEVADLSEFAASG